MMLKKRFKGLTIIEAMVALTIVVFLASVGVAMMGPMVQRHEMMNYLRYVRSAVIKAKANALEYSAPVRMSIDADGSILIVRDNDRDGDFSDTPALVMGVSTAKGEPIPYAHVLVDDDKGGVDLPIWFQDGVFSGAKANVFPNGGFIVMANGRVSDYDLDSTSGTFFFKTENGYNFGAIHITSMGEVKLATMFDGDQGTGEFNGWNWSD